MIVLGVGDKIQGNCSAATVVDYTASGLVDGDLAPLAEGQLPLALGDLYTAATVDVVKTVTLVNTDTVARMVHLYYLKSGGTARHIISDGLTLEPKYSLHTDFEKVTVLDPSGAIVTTAVAQDISGKEDKSNKDATGGYAGLTLFKLNLKNAANTFTNFFTNATTAVRTWTMPDKDGTVAMTSDIATVVIAAAVIPDNDMMRGDGGARGGQGSGITADDNGGVLGAGTVVENVAGAFSAFDLTDIGRTFIATGTTATWTFPANASIAYPIGTPINGINKGSGLLTIALTSDTLDSKGSLVDVSVGAAFTMVKTAATAWTLAGGLE